MQWPYPSRDQDPWYQLFDSLVIAQDASGYAAREDRQIIMGGGGDISFDAGTGLVTWTAVLEFYSLIAGFKISVAAGSATLEDGEVLYTNLTRSPTQNQGVSTAVANQVPNTDSAIAIAVRDGTAVYWRHGFRIADGETVSVFGPPDAASAVKGIARLSLDPAVATTPIAVGDNDPRVFENRRIVRTIVQPADGSNFNVTISPVMLSTNYIVLPSLGTVAAHFTVNIPDVGRATNQFNVITSLVPNNGETIYFFVAEL